MISSEVQRTLVKSPPELWAELGDPASLARHLGELGEIRITRSEPEKLVEWEAESAKGTVAMKGSGWGTKVTLTASRELSSPQPEPTPQDELDAELQPSSAGDQTPAAEGSTAEPVALEEIPPAEEEPSSSGLDAWSRQQADFSDLSLTAAERFGHEHPATLLGTDLQRAADRELETEQDPEEAAAEPVEPVVRADQALPVASVETAAEPGPQAQADVTEVAEPRRGLFARLFGFGRRRSSSSVSAAVPTEAPMSIETVAEADEAVDATPEEPVSSSPAVSEPVAAASDAEIATVESFEPAEPTPTEPALEELEIAATEPGLEEAQPAAETTPSADLTAELKAAEEEVSAILTGVLDRLGAAHHRPFSRS